MKKQALVFVFLLVTSINYAQKPKTIEGKTKDLKGITSYNLEFDYSDVQIPKYDSEEEFLKDKMAKREEKEAGTGEKFKESWFADRENRYEPKFIESFNKRFTDGEMKADKEMTEAKYTIKIHTTKLYAGYNVGVWRQNAEIDAVLTVYETENPSTVLWSGKYAKVQGYGAMGNDYNSGYRISECYAKLAKEFTKLLKKASK
ncbi:hypothetical protein EGM88_05115 [Aureibaculum marinum]|uniref:DUF4136 domain-containing protein n=1 Tax=Aureibaculum marinum TaxID=2487930 RepID=A0A3N4NSA4_9FLAO|nr:hypothetical protein [Aureibaculum marinum]RPD98575.1 hypothetical protein EGM88_05115 [Aureibaculum marinum]